MDTREYEPLLVLNFFQIPHDYLSGYFWAVKEKIFLKDYIFRNVLLTAKIYLRYFSYDT
jgi:hypothetical protein